MAVLEHGEWMESLREQISYKNTGVPTRRRRHLFRNVNGFYLV